MLSRLARVLLAVDSFAQENPVFKDMIQSMSSSHDGEYELVRVVLRVGRTNHVHWKFSAIAGASGFDTEVKFKLNSQDGHSGQDLSDVSERLALLEPFDTYVRRTFVHPVAFQWKKNHA